MIKKPLLKQLFIATIILLSVFCARKPILWQGHYANFVTPENPKEDFKVGEFLVVSYAPSEELKYSKIFYKFAIIKDSTQIGLISYEKIAGSGYLLVYEYFDKYDPLIDKRERFFETEKKSLMTLALYRLPLSYNELKYFVTTTLLNLKELTYVDYTTEGDTITLSFNPDGKWHARISRDIKVTFAVPRILKINKDITVFIKDRINWQFADNLEILEKNTADVVIITPEPKKIASINYELIEKKPQLVSSPKPYYPRELIKKGIEGSVIVGMVIDVDGSVLSCKVIKSSGYAELDFSALSAGLKYKFTPAIQGGKPVIVSIACPFNFRLSD
ncbi:MAG: energy transducer TonB [candidate division WOR-3 bacterium]